MDHVFYSIGIMLCAHILYEFLDWLANKLSKTSKYKIATLVLTVISIGCGMLSFPFFALSAWYEQKFRKVHKEIFLEDRKPYEDVLNSQIAALSAENERLQSKIDLTDKRHRDEVSDARNNGYKSGYVNGYAVGFEDCVSRFSIQDVPEHDLKRMARLSGIHRIKSRRSIFDEVEAVERDGILT